MTTTRCMHGMDSRFCAVCNKATRGGLQGSLASPTTDISEILRFLNDARIRASDSAIADVLGIPPRSLGAVVGDRRAEASWVVNSDTGLPSGYEQNEWHPELLATSEVIRTGRELTLRMTLWRSTSRTSKTPTRPPV